MRGQVRQRLSALAAGYMVRKIELTHSIKEETERLNDLLEEENYEGAEEVDAAISELQRELNEIEADYYGT